MIRRKVGDTKPLELQLKRPNGALIALGVAGTARFLMKPVIVGQGNTVDDAMVVVDQAAAIVRWDPGAGDVDIAGPHYAEVEVTFGDGTIETVPNGEYIEIVFVQDLG